MRKLSLLGIIILILICHSLDAATIHVDINNVGQEDGTQTQPFNTIQEGIDQARDGDTVLVNDGRYVGHGNINLSFEGKAIIVKSVNGPSATIIDCENLDDTKGFIFNTHETTSSMLDGFTITNGNARSFGGGAIFCTSSPLITNCVIMGNTANDNGGGGVIFDGSSAVITNSIIAANTANYGGGIVCVSGAEPTIINCTITGNQAISGEGGGMAFFGLQQPPVIKNTIIWGNIGATPEVHLGTINAVISITFSDVQGGKEAFGGDEAAIADSTYRNNINADPFFVNPVNGDYRLANGSPCIDAGTADGAPDTDIEGNRRPFGAVADIGAYENNDVQVVDDRIIYVDATNQGEEDGSEARPFNTIQEGIDAAENGNTVQVAAGTYSGPIEFKDGIVLQGAGREVTIIIADEGESVIDVTDVGVGQIDGFTIDARAIIEDAIALDRAVVAITNNIITGAESSGIFAQSSAPTIAGNELVKNMSAGIHLNQSDAIVMGNVIKENGWVGILCEVRANAIITDNEITLNGSHGIALSRFSAPKIQNNQIVDNGEKGIHAEGASATIEDNFISQNSIGIGGSTADMTIHKNTIVENLGDGIQIDRSNPIISQNEIRGNQGHAILLVNSSGGSVNDNTIAENGDHGVFISQASPTLEGNTVTDNAGDGVYCAGGSNPTIVNNTLSFNRANGIGVNRDENGEAGATIRGNRIIGNTIYGIGVLSTAHSSVVITGNEISENINSGVSLLDDGEIVTTSAQIVSNQIINNGSSGIENHRGSAYIRGNLITGNFDNGVWIKNEETTPDLGTATDLGNNAIHGNRNPVQLWNETPHDIQAVGNFWGNGTEADGPRDLIGNGGGGNVLFSPWLRLEPRIPEISAEIPAPIETPILIPDLNLRRALEEALGKNPGEEIIAEDLATWTDFEARGRNISDLTGLEYAASLTTLSLEDNQIEDLSPLANLTNLQQLYLSSNPITDIQPIENLTHLTELVLGSNTITDFSPLGNLTNLTSLELWDNQITDIDFVVNLTNLTHLALEDNRISDISPLANLTNLNELDLDTNQISDLTPLVDNSGLAAGDTVNVRNNPLSPTSLNTHIPALQARGVNVLFDAATVVGPAANIEVSISTGSLTVGSGETAEIIITVTDESGNPVMDETITLTISPQNGSVTETASHQGNGVYKGIYTAGDTQAEDIFIEVEASNGIKDNVTLKLTEAVLTQISFGSQLPPLVFAGGIIPISLVGTDDKGNTVEVPSDQIIWGFSGDAIGTIEADSLQFTAKFVGKAKIIATLKSNAAITAESNEITVLAGAAAVVKVESSTLNLTAGSGDTAKLTITVTDEFGNSVTNETIILTHAPATGNLPRTATNQGDGTYIATYTALGEVAEDIFIEAETSNAVKDSISITLVEKDAEPPLVITLDKTSLSFDTVKVGESKQETLTITNPNESDVVVSGITSSRGEFTVSPTSFTLNPGINQTVTVSFKPIITGAVSATLTIASNAATKTIAMSGTGQQQTLSITLDKTSLNFGTVKVGQSKQETLTITNPNDSDVVVSAITSSRGEFTISPTSFTLNPSSSQTITVTFKPATAGAISATVTIASNADVKTVAVSGTGEPQTLSITVDKISLSFGTVKVGESKQETLTITNPNASDVVVSAITSTRGEFVVAPASFTLNPGSSQTITATFRPATAGAITAVLTITSNALTKIIFVFGSGETTQPTFGTLTEISFANAPPQMIAGGTFQFSITSTDTAGQTEAVASGDVVWAVSGGVGTVTDSGELTVTTVGKGVVKAMLKANATLIAETAEITVIAAQAEKVQISMTPDNLTAGSGETATATITVTDEFENPVTGLIITMTATDGNISSTATEAGNGIYNAAYTAGTTIGNVEIRATTPNRKIGTSMLTLKEKETTETPTFELTARDEVMIAGAGEETVSYRLRLDGKNGFSDTIELFASELPPNVTAKIDPKTITLSEAEPIDISDLTLTLPADLVGNDYSFTVFARAGDGQSKVLTLTLKVESAERVSTRLTLTVQPSTVAFMETLNLSGELVPLTNTPVELGNAKVTITFIAPSEREYTFETTTDENGNYKLVTPFLPDEVGGWTVISKFVGNDELKLTERESTFTVTKGDAKITFSSGETGALGTTIEIVGQLTPGLEDEEIALKVLRPDGAASQITNITTETLGVFRYSLELDLAGDWEFTAIWSGNTQYEDETQKLVISVTKEIGKAILVLGGGDRNDNPAWKSFNGVAEYVHNILLKREFNDEDDIWFLSPDPTRTSGADTQTTQSNLQLAITNWAKSRANPQVPLFIYLLSHNLEDKFLLEKRGNSETFLTPDLLDGWLDQLPEGTPVTIIIEACHSGNFITVPLIGENRTIIVSASADRQAKITPSLSSFSKIFFDQINLNKTIAEAFRFTQAKMLVLRTHRSQQPQMDANANGQANQPQDFAVVSSRYIPENIVSLADPPEFIKITEATTLGEGISSLRIETELLGVAVNRVFATVIPPDFNPDQRFDDWSALAFDEFDLANVGEGKYAATYANFTQPGEYTILVNASNPDGSADPVQTTITVPGGVTSATPWDVDGSGVVDIFDLVIVGGNFGKSGAGIQGDANGDGVVNIFDLVLVGQHFGERSNQ